MKIFVLGLLGVLAACGGGGGADSGLKSLVTVSGVAAKGLLLHAKVQAFEIEPDGRESQAALATTITNDQGEYTLTSLPSGANLVLRVSRNDSSSMMMDEASGNKVSLGTSLVLSHLIQTSEQSVIEAHITPFSEAAYARARFLGLASDKIATNINEARQLVQSQMVVNLDQRPGFSDAVKPLNPMAEKLVTFSKAVKSNPCGCTQPDLSGQTQCMVDVMVGNAQKGDLKLFSELVNKAALEGYSKVSAISSQPEILSGVMTQGVQMGASSSMFASAATNKTMTARTAATQSRGNTAVGMGSKSSVNRNLIRVSTSATLPSSGSNLSVNGNLTTASTNAAVNGSTNASLPSSGSNLSVNSNLTTTPANVTVNGLSNATLSVGSNPVGTSGNLTVQSISSICSIKPFSGTLTVNSL